MTSPISKLFGQTALYGLPSILGRLLNYLLVPLYTAVFAKPADYGVLSDLYAYVAFLMILLPLGMETAYFRFIQEDKRPDHVFNNAFIPVVLVNSFVFLALYFSNPWIAKWMLYKEHTEFVIMIGSIVCIDAISALPLARLRAENKAKRFVTIQMSSISVNIILNLVFLLLFFNPTRPEEGILFVLIANLMASSLKVVLVYDLISKVRITPDWELIKKMLVYSFPLIIAGFAGIINETLDRVLLKQILYNPDIPNSLEQATAQVGIYSACYKLAMLVTILLQAYRYAAEPFFFSQMNSQNKNVVFARVMNLFIAIVCLAFLFVSLNLSLFKFFIRKDAYYVGLKVVPILLFANVCLGIYYNQSVWYKLSNKTKFGAYISLIGASVTIIVNLLFIPMYGYMACAWATLLAYLTQMTLSYYWGQKYYPIPYNSRRFFLYIVSAIAIYCVFSLLRMGMKSSVKEVNMTLIIIGNLMIMGYIYLVYSYEKAFFKPKK
ncbi:MAG: polysaccharide biosynthesis protein [Flavobacteriia bacterium]|nr:polysaccharide biosynthesis protein [Flavobacteriia bacterium]